MVMSTGVISIASSLHGFQPAAAGLASLNLILFAVLFIATLVRLTRFRDRFVADLTNHQRGVGFFTTVAATSILGTQMVLVSGRREVGFGFWILALALWMILIYSVFAALTVKQSKPPLSEGINGGWLIAVVATESISILGSLTSTLHPAFTERMLFLSLSFWLFGGMFYIWLISLIFYRYTFFEFSPDDLMPPYWINMGAMAIAALAGSTLVWSAPSSPLLMALLPFLKGFTIFFWATATWWIPMLLILAVWRHVIRKRRLKYDLLYWGAVFPVGMYTVCTYRLGHWLDLPFMGTLSAVFMTLSFTAWGLAFTGMSRATVKSILTEGRQDVI